MPRDGYEDSLLWRPGLPCELPIKKSKELDTAQGIKMVCVTLGSQGASLDCKGFCFASCVPPSRIPGSVVNSHSNGDPFYYHFLSTPLALSMDFTHLKEITHLSSVAVE